MNGTYTTSTALKGNLISAIRNFMGSLPGGVFIATASTAALNLTQGKLLGATSITIRKLGDSVAAPANADQTLAPEYELRGGRLISSALDTAKANNRRESFGSFGQLVEDVVSGFLFGELLEDGEFTNFGGSIPDNAICSVYIDQTSKTIAISRGSNAPYGVAHAASATLTFAVDAGDPGTFFE